MANGPNIFQMLLVRISHICDSDVRKTDFLRYQSSDGLMVGLVVSRGICVSQTDGRADVIGNTALQSTRPTHEKTHIIHSNYRLVPSDRLSLADESCMADKRATAN